LLNCHYWIPVGNIYARKKFGSVFHNVCPYCGSINGAFQETITWETEQLCLEDEAFAKDYYFKHKTETEANYVGYKNPNL
jgi:hypothetical protein